MPTSGRVLVCLAALLCSAAPAQQAPLQPVSPNEIEAGMRMFNSSMQLSPDGRWLAFSTVKGEGVTDLAANKTVNVPGKWRMLDSGSWSPADATLALSLRREGRFTLNLWSAGTAGQTNTREVMAFPRKLYPDLPPLWSPDGKTLLFVVNQNLPWPKSHAADDHPPTTSVNVTLEMTAPYRVIPRRPRFEKEYEEAYAESNRSLILALDLQTGRIGVIAKGNDVRDLFLSPDGKRIAAVQSRHDRGPVHDVYVFDVPAAGSLRTVDLETLDDRRAGWSDHTGKRPVPVLTDLFDYYLMWSPDSRYFTYATQFSDRTNDSRRTYMDLFLHEVATRTSRNLTEKITLNPSGKSLGYGENQDRVKAGQGFSALWMPDGQSLVATGGCEVWNIPLDAAQSPRLLSTRLPLEARKILTSPRRGVASVDEQGRITVMAKERLSRLDSFWKIDVRSAAAQKLADTGVWVNTVVTDNGGKRIVYNGQTGHSSTNIAQLVMAGEVHPQALTRYKQELAGRAFPDTRVLEYKTSEGRVGFGLLYLPSGADAGHPAPLVVHGSPGEFDSVVDARAKAGAAFYDESTHGFLKEGIAVLYPDIAVSDLGVYERPLKQVVDGVMMAVDAALATGAVDAKRMGIMGRKYGGFMVQAAVTQTDRFKAAVSIGGTSNWFASYLNSADAPRHYELGYGRFEKPLWEAPQRYVESSPLTYWDQVRTPLLLIESELDMNMQRVQESYRGLERLDRTTILARYQRGLTLEALRRAQGWFREHLLGQPPITQIADQGSFMFGSGDDAPPL